jgi:hypothetical protein
MDATIIDLIRPHTGDIEHVKPAPAGFGSATTGLVTAQHGEFFVKATPQDSRDLEAARREAAINPAVREVSPAVRWQVEDGAWFVVAFEVVEGRSADFAPGSADLPLLIDIVNQVSALPTPDIAQGWQDTRWDRFATDTEKDLLRGDALTHTDIHGRNVLIGDGRTWLVDWEWPTIGAAAIMPSCLAVQLVSSGHSPESAESWVAGCDAWKAASDESVDAFARANARMNRWFAQLRPEEKWLDAMAEAAEAWAAYRGSR